jgi:cell division protein ZapA
MPELTVEVGGRSYRLGCGEGEENHLQGLAKTVDTEATRLTRQLGQMPEGRLMLMVALMLADRMTEAEALSAENARLAAEAGEAVEHAATHPEVSDTITPEREAQISASLDDLAARIDTLVGRIEGHA